MSTRAYFEDLCHRLLQIRRPREHLLMNVSGEKSQFIRMNGAKIRQSGCVEDAHFELTLLLEGADPSSLRKATSGLTLSGLLWQDWPRIQSILEALRKDVPTLPVDPYALLPQNHGSLISETSGELLPLEKAPEVLLGGRARSLDLAGIYAAGSIFRGMANSEGQILWFSTETFSMDYSVYTQGQKAVKQTYAGRQWSQSEYQDQLEQAGRQVEALGKAEKKMSRGSYRTYLAPSAVADLIAMMSWGCVSEASVQQGESPLRGLRQGERSFSSRFSLSEDFSAGLVPRFNEWGETAKEKMPVIERGNLKNTLISSRTAKEYGLVSNSAIAAETLRSPVVAVGDLKHEDILKRIDTGLYLSNLHYLNWSDQPGGRITGMTRYACFWVEKGQIQAPIENMRWDDSIFALFGSELEDLTSFQNFIPNVSSYEQRSLGGMQVPGALLSSMTFTI